MIEVAQAIIKSHQQLKKEGYKLYDSWRNKMAIIASDDFATFAMHFDCNEFAKSYPEAYDATPDKDKVSGFVVSLKQMFCAALDKDNKVISCVHHYMN